MGAQKRPVSLQEFKAWLEGVEELQEKTWSPDAKQWKLIRNKINNIIIPEPSHTAPIESGDTQLRYPPLSPTVPLIPILNSPEVPSSIPDFEITAPSAAAAAMLRPATPAQPSKTPNIESGADGSVKSSFA